MFVPFLTFTAIVLYSGLDKSLIPPSALFWENKKLNEIPVLSLITVLLFKNPDGSNALFKLLCEYFSSTITFFFFLGLFPAELHCVFTGVFG